ncbi:hypothetical protein DPX16_1618 [Anabarilius grahami]|uniref:Uncharacterized protein n=1 Tax=Anabarilius grahami TaxID=495550 RepID=A0A3N0Z8T4_ANAGA|nr:hypothetical protein DPX16_1618 [Anabarilius grahami]
MPNPKALPPLLVLSGWLDVLVQSEALPLLLVLPSSQAPLLIHLCRSHPAPSLLRATFHQHEPGASSELVLVPVQTLAQGVVCSTNAPADQQHSYITRRSVHSNASRTSLPSTMVDVSLLLMLMALRTYIGIQTRLAPPIPSSSKKGIQFLCVGSAGPVQLHLLRLSLTMHQVARSPAPPCCVDPLAPPLASEPIIPPQTVDLSDPSWLLATSAPPGTIIPPDPTWSVIILPLPRTSTAFGCALFLYLFGSVGLLLTSGSASVLTPIGSTSVFQHPDSTSAVRHQCSALVSWSSGVTWPFHPSDTALVSTSLSHPPFICSAVDHHLPGRLLSRSRLSSPAGFHTASSRGPV